MNLTKYEKEKYLFESIIKNWFDVDDLSELHKIKKYKLFKSLAPFGTEENDQSTHWHNLFYKNYRIDPIFANAYMIFLRDIILPRYSDGIIYQKIPTFRIHFPNNIAVGEFHKDKQYRDVMWAEQVNEINYYVPLTSAYDTNTIWAESKEDLGDYSSFNCEYGDCVEWDASNLMHGNKVNKENKTRVSFDFRVIRKKDFISSSSRTMNANVEFDIGGYYEEMV